MLSIKRAAGLGATVAVLAALGPVAAAGADPVPVPASTAVQPITVTNANGDVSQPGADVALAAWRSQAGAALTTWDTGNTAALSGWQSALATLPPGLTIPAAYALPAGLGFALPGR
jgi:hypothetical protein